MNRNPTLHVRLEIGPDTWRDWDSLKMAAHDNGIGQSALGQWLSRNEGNGAGFYRRRVGRKGRPCEYDGVAYGSITEAAQAHGIMPCSMRYRLGI
jgi:hypothetical protein